jgi:O-antigen/teichoic acid export membrane protein
LAGRGLVRRIVGGTVNYGLGQFLPQIVGFLLMPLYTALLAPEDYGALDVAASLLGLLTVVMRLGLPGAVTRFYYEHAEGPALADYVTTVFAGLVGAGTLVALGAVATAPWWAPAGAPGLTATDLGLVLVAAVASAVSDLQRRLLQAREQSRYSAQLNVVSAFAGIALALVLVAGLRWGVFGMLLAQATTAVAFAVQALGYLRPDLRGRFRVALLRESAVYGAAVLPSHAVVALAPLATRALLAGFDSVAAVGLLSLATRFASPLFVLGNAFNTAYIPIDITMRKDTDPEAPGRLVRLMRSAWVAGVFVALGAATVGPPVLVLITPAEYHAAADLLPILALGFVFQMAYWLFGNEIFYSKRTWLSPVVTIASSVTTVGVTVVAAPRWGALGVALATSAGSVVAGAVAVVFATRLVSLPHRWIALAAPLALATGLWALTAALPVASPVARAVVGVASCALLPAAMWTAGDDVIRDLAARVRDRIPRLKERPS